MKPILDDLYKAVMEYIENNKSRDRIWWPEADKDSELISCLRVAIDKRLLASLGIEAERNIKNADMVLHKVCKRKNPRLRLEELTVELNAAVVKLQPAIEKAKASAERDEERKRRDDNVWRELTGGKAPWEREENKGKQ